METDDAATGDRSGRPAYLGQVYAGVGLLLLLALLLTAGLRSQQLKRVAETMPARQAAAVEGALARAEADFARLQQTLHVQARAIAEASVVQAALTTAGDAERYHAPEPLVDYFAALSVPDRGAVELYDPMPGLVAWAGFSMPLDDAPSRPDFLKTAQTAVAEDGEARQALVVWQPVRAGVRVVGVVRVLQQVTFDAPVRNEYLRDYSLAEEWTRATGLNVVVQLGPDADPDGIYPGPKRVLQGLDGEVLGYVSVEPPSPEVVLADTRRRFADLMALWALLLLAWGLAGIGWGYRRTLTSRGGRLRHAAAWFACFAAAWWGARWALLALNVPARWQEGKAPLAPLFDPMHLASTAGAGLMRSIGDLAITALFAVAFAWALLALARRIRGGRAASATEPPEAPDQSDTLWLMGRIVALVVALTVLVIALAGAVHHAVLDSTLDYFTRTGLLPQRLVLVVFCALLLLAVAVLAGGVALTWMLLAPLLQRFRPLEAVRNLGIGLVVAMAGVVTIAYALVPWLAALVPWYTLVAFVVCGVGLGVQQMVVPQERFQRLTLRTLLPYVLLLTVLLYPMLYHGMDAQRRERMMEAAASFEEGRDPRVLFAIEQVLEEVQDDAALLEALADPEASLQARLDSFATAQARGTLLSSLGTYDVSLTFFREGQPVGRYHEAERSAGRAALDQVDRQEFDIMQRMYEESRTQGVLVEQVTGRRDRDRFQYKGLVPLEQAGGVRVGWAMVRAEPETLLRDGATPFPRVLIPAGFYGNLYADLSLAAFYDGVLVRSFGRHFGRYRLAEDVVPLLRTQAEVWRYEEVKERTFLTYYHRSLDTPGSEGLGPLTQSHVVAVRMAAFNTFDHLYYLLRLTIAGLFVALPVYLVGLYLRRRAGLLPAPRTRFRDKVLNAFFSVSLIAVTAMGFVGLQVVTGENERAIQSWLRQHLERVEETLALKARGDELPYQVLDRVALDSLAALVGLDLNVYQGTRLEASSRPQLIRDRLVDERLPVEAYQAFYYDGFRFTYTQEQVGSFTYTAGFRALLDEEGRPRYVLSVPTLPEQERIEEERARTVAYLFGALLLLMVVVMLTAALLAGALTRPIGRLRQGLEAVARGRFERPLPVGSRDEIGELVETFNEMQEQLAESRRKLAQQERQLAWREMARQVAHEIKNPLTPMRLKVQHLQRAYSNLRPGSDPRFERLFESTTETLIEQIEALVRIANDFSTFAKLPQRIVEPLDLNGVVQEAVRLMEAEAEAEITVDLHPEPLVLEGDHEELRRVFINLIKNAIQAIPEDREGRVDVTTTLEPGGPRTPGHAYVTVTDNGAGVAEDQRDRIFEPNFSTKSSGTGLGLAIIAKAIEELNGEVGFETEEDVGTTFWLRLPLMDE